MRLARDEAANVSVGSSAAASPAASAAVSAAASTVAGGPTADAKSAAEPEAACSQEGGRSLVLWVGLKFRAIARSHLEFYAMLKTPKNAKDRTTAAAGEREDGQ
jgi:hypothetical protein